MLRCFNKEYYKYEDGKFFCDDEEINMKDLKAMYIETLDPIDDIEGNIFVVRMKMQDNKLLRLSRTNDQHCAIETLKELSKIFQDHGDFAQYGSSVLNLATVSRVVASRENGTVDAIFKDEDKLEIVNTPFPRIAIKCFEKLKRDLIKYKTTHRTM